MMKTSCLTLVGIGMFALAFSLAPPDASAEDFYKGKTIRFIVGYAPGGGYDTYTRAIARHIGKHIPGNPSAVVDNMEGAGSLLAANYMFNKADARWTHRGQFQ